MPLAAWNNPGWIEKKLMKEEHTVMMAHSYHERGTGQ